MESKQNSEAVTCIVTTNRELERQQPLGIRICRLLKWPIRFVLFFISYVILAFVFDWLGSTSVLQIVPVVFVFGGLAYIVYFAPRAEEKRDNLAFDNLVLGFVDGLSFSGNDIGCGEYELRHDVRRYVKEQLSKAHALHGNQFLIEYKTEQGRLYCSHTGKKDHALFAILCIAQYAKTHDNHELLSWCESNMLSAERLNLYL